MRFNLRRWARLAGPPAAIAIAIGCIAAPLAFPIAAEPEVVLVRLTGEPGEQSRPIRDSKWGYIGRLQQAINEAAPACGIAPIKADGRFGLETATALQAVAACRDLPIAADGGLTSELYRALVGEAPPSALARARMLSRTLEATDYDDLHWNVCTRYRGDRNSVLTWGPYGKTLGWGGEMLDLLRQIDRSKLNAAFESAGAKGLERLLALPAARLTDKNRHRYPRARALMESICRQPGQMEAWRKAFATLGADAEVRRLYDAHVWGEEAWFRNVTDRLGASWRAVGLQPTEIDFAFFLDRAIHMGWGKPRFAAVDAALAAAKARTPKEQWNSARARLAVADAVRPAGHPEDRLARDVIYLIDAEQDLGPLMAASRTWPKGWRQAWRGRAGFAASDVGLSDARPAPNWDAPTEEDARVAATFN